MELGREMEGKEQSALSPKWQELQTSLASGGRVIECPRPEVQTAPSAKGIRTRISCWILESCLLFLDFSQIGRAHV